MNTVTLSLFEDNAGGLSLLRHDNHGVIIGLDFIYANGGFQQGDVLSADETAYWLALDTNTENATQVDEWYYRHSDGHQFRFEADGENADCFADDGQNEINLIARYDKGTWETYPDKMGTNGTYATANHAAKA